MGVKHPQLQIQNRLARDAEQEMPRLDDARVNRADGHLKNPLAFHGNELVALALKRRQLRPQIKILAQRMHVRPVVVQRAAARVRMADQFQAEQILHFAFLPVDAGNGVRERRKLRFVRRHRHAQDDETVRRVEREHVVKMEHAFRLPRVVGKQAHEPRVQVPAKMRGEPGDQIHFRMDVNFVRPRRMDGFEPVAKSLLQAGENRQQFG